MSDAKKQSDKELELPRDEEAMRALLERSLLSRASPKKQRLLGLEFEALRVRRQDGVAAPSTGEDGPDEIVLDLARTLAEGGEIEAVIENDVLSVVHLGPTNLSLEPGGQLEISFSPRARIGEVLDVFEQYVPMIEKRLEDTPYRVLYLGHQPKTMPDEIPLRGKPRYSIMDRRLRRVEKLGPHMMRATAGQQLTLDFRDQREAMRMLRASTVAAPFLTAIFANSPFVGGKLSGHLSFREKAWLHTDPTRCGAPALLLNGDDSLDAYIDFALSAEAWFRHGASGVEEIPAGSTWRELWESGERLTLADFELHSSTLFPTARIRGGVELRSADCTPPEFVPAFLALIVGALYDEESREACLELHPYRTQAEVDALHEAVAQQGPKAQLPDGFEVLAGCRALVEHAEAGLRRLEARGEIDVDAWKHLAALHELLADGSCPANAAIERQQSRGEF